MFARQMEAGGVKKEKWHSKLRHGMKRSQNSTSFSTTDYRVRGKRQEAGQRGLKREAGGSIVEDLYSMVRVAP